MEYSSDCDALLIMTAHVQHNTGNQEWYTPEWIITAARATMGGIDLDPASNPIANAWIHATRYHTKDDDGLLAHWSGRVWLNPPYTNKLVSVFVDKLEQSLPTIDAACVLVNNGTETQWGQKLLRLSTRVCFLSRRVRFILPNGRPLASPLQGQMVCYFGPTPERFYEEFQPYGIILSL